MPHMLIEYTKGLEDSVTPSDLINSVYKGACDSELFDNNLIKTRSIVFDNYQSGLTQSNFIHVTARILAGRTETQRKTLTSSILSELKSLLEGVSPISITVEVVDIEKETHSEYLA